MRRKIRRPRERDESNIEKRFPVEYERKNAEILSQPDLKKNHIELRLGTGIKIKEVDEKKNEADENANEEIGRMV